MRDAHTCLPVCAMHGGRAWHVEAASVPSGTVTTWQTRRGRAGGCSATGSRGNNRHNDLRRLGARTGCRLKSRLGPEAPVGVSLGGHGVCRKAQAWHSSRTARPSAAHAHGQSCIPRVASSASEPGFRGGIVPRHCVIERAGTGRAHLGTGGSDVDNAGGAS